MDVKTISMPKVEAEKAYKEYLAIVKTRKEEYVEDLKKVYHALKEGKKVMDIYDAFKKTGVNEEGDPKLAIAVADEKNAFFFKEDGGAGSFTNNINWSGYTSDVRLPGDTFPRWKMQKNNFGGRSIKRRRIITKVPIVPSHLMPKGSLKNYYLLWEADKWKEAKTPIAAKDPFLLRRINANTFIVFAAWDLTEVEQMVMKGQ